MEISANSCINSPAGGKNTPVLSKAKGGVRMQNERENNQRENNQRENKQQNQRENKQQNEQRNQKENRK